MDHRQLLRHLAALYVVFLSLALPGRFAKACAVLAAIAMRLTGTRAAYLGFAVGAAV